MLIIQTLKQMAIIYLGWLKCLVVSCYLLVPFFHKFENNMQSLKSKSAPYDVVGLTAGYDHCSESYYSCKIFTVSR